MRKNVLLAFFSLLLSICSNSQKTPKRELRGAWITTHFGLDWPTSSQTPAQQRSALISILDQHKATGMNAIYFQVRNQCDALYPSTIEPWSSTLTGTQGKDPGWDPLQFVIDETHKRGMELHAWLNPYRAVATASQLPNFVENHVAKQHPGWLLNNGSVITLNPGLPAVRDYIMSVINDITSRYDIDGIHFDDYFYSPPPVRDTATYNADPRGMNQADWRRDNINIFIKRVYEETMALKPWVKFGVSPSGIYRNGVNVGGSATSGSEHYSAVYADSKKWLQEKWVDYIAPQVYWHIGFSVADYGKLIPWWNSNAFGRHIYIGMASYKVNMTFGATGNGPVEQAAWKIPTQYPNELRMNRLQDYLNVFGEIHYRTATLTTNALGHRDSTRLNIYRKPDLPPTMSWRDATPPPAPSALTAAKQSDNSYILSWTKPAATSNELDKVRQFIIYRSESPVINVSDTANLLFITNTDITTYTDNLNPSNKTYYYTVTSVDRLYNESVPSNVTDYVPPTITCPENQTISLNSSCSATLPDYTGQAPVSDDVSSPENITVTQSPAVGTVINGISNNTITLTATDASGKKSTCRFTVNGEDKEVPVITPANPSVAIGSKTQVSADAGRCAYTATNDFDIRATDNCSNSLSYSYTLTNKGVTGGSVTAATLQGAVLAKGVTLVSWTVTDNSGNASTYSYSIEVLDQEAPVITCPANLTVSSDLGRCAATVNITPAKAIDNCAVASITGTRNDQLALTATYPKGTTTITWTAVDEAGNKTSCTQTVEVKDAEAPALTVPANITIATDKDLCSAVVLYETSATDNCSPVSIVSDYPSGTAFPKGTTTVTVTATDEAGNKTVKTFTVIVKDEQLPVITCGNNRSVGTDPGVCNALITLVNPVATDNCPGVTIGGKRSDSQGLTAPYPKGATTITWTATDAAGNKTTCTQTITVEDREKPVITDAYTNPSVLTAPNHKMRTVKVFYKVSDNCGPVTSVLSVASNEDQLNDPEDDEPGADYQVLDNHTVKLRAARSGSGNGRVYTITITATDASGNVSTEVVTVLVPHDRSDLITGSQVQTSKENLFVQKELEVRALPNPSTSEFTLIINSSHTGNLQLRITDNLNRKVETKKAVSPNGTIRIGATYRPGIYYIEVIQGNKRVILKLLKQ